MAATAAGVDHDPRPRPKTPKTLDAVWYLDENWNGMIPSRANTPAPPSIVLVGPGRVGTALSRAAHTAGIEVTLAGRHDLADACTQAEVVLLCVPDAEITATAEAVAAAALSLRSIGHTSGATGLEALTPATGSGAEAFSLHPLQTIPDGESDLLDSPAAIEGSTPAVTELARGLAEALGMRPFGLPPEARAAYHAAASMASNFLIALEESAAGLLRDAGIEGGRGLLTPLVLRTAANWADSGGAALTGPIARGDAATVDRHLAAIATTSPELEELYRALAARTQVLARVGERA